MKAVILTATLSMLTALNLNANAACTPPNVAEAAVSGRTYILKNSPHPEAPVYLTFGSSTELLAGYGSALDGHPGGTYHYQGNCHGHIIVTFTSGLQPDSKPIEVLHLKPTNAQYFHLRSVNDSDTLFSIVVDEPDSSGLQLNTISTVYKRYVWGPSLEDLTKYVCWDDKAGIEVAGSYCGRFQWIAPATIH